MLLCQLSKQQPLNHFSRKAELAASRPAGQSWRMSPYKQSLSKNTKHLVVPTVCRHSNILSTGNQVG